MDGISVLVRGAQRAPLFLLPREGMVSRRRYWICQCFDLGFPSLQNCEKETLVKPPRLWDYIFAKTDSD